MLHFCCISVTNHLISQFKLPNVGALSRFSCQPYVFEHPHLSTIAQFRLSNAGLRNRYPRFVGALYNIQKTCPMCQEPKLSESHLFFFCPSVEHFIKDFDLTTFRTVARVTGFTEEETFRIYINGFNWNGCHVPDTDFVARGHALDTIRGHWLTLW